MSAVLFSLGPANGRDAERGREGRRRRNGTAHALLDLVLVELALLHLGEVPCYDERSS